MFIKNYIKYDKFIFYTLIYNKMDNLNKGITLVNPQDSHIHLRGYNGLGDDNSDQRDTANNILETAAHTLSNYSRVFVMPNTIPRHLETTQDILDYQELLSRSISQKQHTELLFSVSLTENIKPENIQGLSKVIKWIKYYPGGVTTNSGSSSWDIDINNPQTRWVLQEMEKHGVVLNIHGETTHEQDTYGHTIKWFVHDAEQEFVPIISKIASEFPNLTIVAEHMSSKEMVELVGSNKHKNLYWGVDINHLIHTAHDKEGGHGFDPHIHQKPTLKWPEDRKAIQNIVLSGNTKVFYGSDSAPHPIDAKESACCAAGVFVSPIWIELLVDWFLNPTTIKYAISKKYITGENPIAEMQAILQKFVGENVNQVYWDPTIHKTLTLEKKDFIIQESYGDTTKIVPFRSNQTLSYSVIDVAVKTKDQVLNTFIL